MHNSENQATWDSDLCIHLCSVILVNNAKGEVNTHGSQTAVCIIMATQPRSLQSELAASSELPSDDDETLEGRKGLVDHDVEQYGI